MEARKVGIFRTGRSASGIPESPSLLFADLRKAPHIKFLWAHQASLLDDYHQNYLDLPNVALELPTGAGKTLIGLLIAEYRRKAKGERVVYLCPTRQLGNQVKAQAGSYGINCSLLVGRQRDYPEHTFFAYQHADAVGITTYSGLFNISPKISDPQVVVCDDAHAADNYMADLWSLRVRRGEQADLFKALTSYFASSMTDDMRRRMRSTRLDAVERLAVDLVPLPKYADRSDGLAEILEAYCTAGELQYRWQLLRQHLDACNVYVSPDAILVRPLIAPSMSHAPFAQANQRVFMSATLGSGGELERSTGIPKIARLPLPAGWDKRSTGRRLILFPNLITDGAPSSAVQDTVRNGDRTLMLAKDNRTADKWIASIAGIATILRPNDVEEDLDPFTSLKGPAVLLLANRYDGIDLPGEKCRRLVLIGLPAAADMQELFFRECLGAFAQLRDRIRTRITQGIGRCTRDEGDYSLVLLVDGDILKWCCTGTNVASMHPELQAEIEFGLKNSANRSMEEFRELCAAFFEQGPDWDEASEEIIELRSKFTRAEDPAAQALQKAAFQEVEFTYAMWRRDFEKAHERAVSAVEALSGGKELRPYQAYWHYAGCVAAYLAWQTSKDNRWQSVFQDHLSRALACTVSVQWLAELKTIAGAPVVAEIAEAAVDASVVVQVLEDWHLRGVRFEREVAAEREAINCTKANRFQAGMETLGRMLGGQATSWSEDGAPDGLWTLNDGIEIVFEYKSDETPGDPVSLATVRQAATHEAWLRKHKGVAKGTLVRTVIVTPRTTIAADAVSVCGDLRVISLEEVRGLFEKAAERLRAIRARAQNLSDEELRDLVDEEYLKDGLAHKESLKMVAGRRLADLPVG